MNVQETPEITAWRTKVRRLKGELHEAESGLAAAMVAACPVKPGDMIDLGTVQTLIDHDGDLREAAGLLIEQVELLQQEVEHLTRVRNTQTWAEARLLAEIKALRYDAAGTAAHALNMCECPEHAAARYASDHR